MYIDSRSSRRTIRSVDIWKVTVLRRFQSLVIRAGSYICSMYQRNRSRPAKPDADESYMALTFGTLLSSQGADAHRHGPFGQIGGNPRYFTWSVPPGQTPAPAQTPTWSGRARIRSISASCLVLGGTFARPRLIGHPLGWPLARLRPANKENISQAEAGMQIRPLARCRPRICWGTCQ